MSRGKVEFLFEFLLLRSEILRDRSQEPRACDEKVMRDSKLLGNTKIIFVKYNERNKITEYKGPNVNNEEVPIRYVKN